MIIGISAAAATCSLAACGNDPSTGISTSPIDNTPGVDSGSVDAAVPAIDSGMSTWLQNDAAVVQIIDPNCSPGNDSDGDGFTMQEGDCNDCDKTVNPGAYDFPGNNFDEDCSGKAAELSEGECDMGLDMASTAADDAARAIGLCKFTTADKRDWGVISARFTTADGSGMLDSPMQVGILPRFGAAAARAGVSILALSSGVARAPDQAGYTRNMTDTFSGTGHTPPTGYPKASSICPRGLFDGLVSKGIFNQAALEVKVRVPTNAFSLSFDSIFYSYEYPEYICAPFNDFFITQMEPHDKGDGNIVFDTNGDPIGVNNGLLAVCDPALQKPNAAKRFDCLQGLELLKGTGFGDGEYIEVGLFGSETVGKGGASTGWLTTLSPAKAGTVITLRFAVWDTGDTDLDSTVLIDRFAWSVEQPTTAVTKPTPILL
jgi:hypothetical protein